MTHLIAKQKLTRANSGLMLALICGGAVLFALAAAAYDIARLFAH